MKLIKTKKQKIKEECWNLDYELVKWLNEHLKVYLEDASKIVDLEFHKFKYKRKDYTKKELIKKLISMTDRLLDDDIKYFDFAEELKNEMYDILKLIHFSLWW